MAELFSEVGPISDATTGDVRVEVLSRPAPEHSNPAQGVWVFEYTVRITNLGDAKVQLISRHWIITDAADNIKEVKGPGVVGHQPLLAKGEAFKYSSWCKLETPTGTMRGTYQMVGEDQGEFDVEIAPFALKAKYTIH